MRYHGGKSKSGNRLSKILQEILDNNKHIETYCEPFSGACGIFTHIAPANENLSLLAGDQNKSMVMCFGKRQTLLLRRAIVISYMTGHTRLSACFGWTRDDVCGHLHIYESSQKPL